MRVCLPTEFSWFTSSLSSFYLLLPCPSGATYLQYYGLLWTKKVHKIISFGKFQNHHFWILIGNFLNDFSNLPTQSENKMFMLDEMNPEKCFMLERVTIFPFFISCYFFFYTALVINNVPSTKYIVGKASSLVYFGKSNFGFLYIGRYINPLFNFWRLYIIFSKAAHFFINILTTVYSFAVRRHKFKLYSHIDVRTL